ETIEQRLCEERDVMRCREDPCVASDSAHAARGGIVHSTACEHVEVRIGTGVGFRFVIMGGGRDAREQGSIPVASGAGVARVTARCWSPGDGSADDPVWPAGLVDGQVARLGHAEWFED